MPSNLFLTECHTELDYNRLTRDDLRALIDALHNAKQALYVVHDSLTDLDCNELTDCDGVDTTEKAVTRAECLERILLKIATAAGDAGDRAERLE